MEITQAKLKGRKSGWGKNWFFKTFGGKKWSNMCIIGIQGGKKTERKKWAEEIIEKIMTNKILKLKTKNKLIN